MKKKLLLLIFAIVSVVCLTFGISACVSDESDTASDGLEYALSDDETCYIVSGIGECTDKDLVIPSTYNGLPVTSIGTGAFTGCPLECVTIPNSVTTIGYCPFSDCFSLKNVYYDGTASQWASISFDSSLFDYYAVNLYFNGTLATDITLEGITTINQYAFCSTSLESVTISNGVTSIEDSTFSHCSSLESVTIADSVTSIGGWAFNGCSALTNITIPDSVTSIGDSVFNGCTSLKSITIPDSVTSIGEGTFGSCTSLESITLSKNITTIGMMTFFNCTALTSINIPDNITYIGQAAFQDCTALTSVTIGNGVNSIGRAAFANCTSLKSITIGSNITSIGESAFHKCTSLKSVTFANTSGWYVTETSGATSGTDVDVTDKSANVTNLTDTYCSYYWYRSES